ncbi:hypothetical protein LEM8419_01656 [Neolewinella maritima]|uniref:LysM domain-containing protein n=1 Tax=Neolewinella maritima TaxID=1383882 RepID=A0ABM9B0J5_9BACT|nr:LysM peptidoglycan-binding domain-containing protein [Neolewinella maritima]CAH1000503.1 hypothetical protein LEM8419_01656 [Neolewinella maritima]
MTQYFFTLLLILFLAPAASATGDSLYFLLPRDTVVLRHDPASGLLLFDHYLAPRQTLYGAARFYGLTLDEVYRLNPTLRSGYTAGTRVTVAIPPVALRSSFTPDSVAWFVPVRYRMAPGETLYGLTRRTLRQPNDQLIRQLNPELDPQQLSPGQVLKIGYLRLDGVPRDSQLRVEDPFIMRNYSLRAEWETSATGKSVHTANGKAAWTSSGDKNKFMVLHRTAPLGSLVEIEDPRSRKTLYARVVGRIPEQAYDPRVVVVVSPLLVRAFGVRDKEFYVRTRHL